MFEHHPDGILEDEHVETNFLTKVVGREPTMDEILQIIYLRKAARRFS